MTSKKNIVLFGNCQSAQIQMVMDNLLSDTHFNVERYSNNSRQENMESSSTILSAIRDADIFIYQPLSLAHKEFSEENLLNNIINDRCQVLSQGYIFNSGIYSLCHAPASPGKSYGKIYGEEIILSLLDEGANLDDILKQYQNGEIDFKLAERFDYCLARTKKDELKNTIKISDFILDNYRNKKLFWTHNHATNLVYQEICRQIQELTNIQFDLDKILEMPEFDVMQSPISPYDVETHGYNFEPHSDWYEKGKKLIEAIVNEYTKSKDLSCVS